MPTYSFLSSLLVSSLFATEVLLEVVVFARVFLLSTSLVEFGLFTEFFLLVDVFETLEQGIRRQTCKEDD